MKENIKYEARDSLLKTLSSLGENCFNEKYIDSSLYEFIIATKISFVIAQIFKVWWDYSTSATQKILT